MSCTHGGVVYIAAKKCPWNRLCHATLYAATTGEYIYISQTVYYILTIHISAWNLVTVIENFWHFLKLLGRASEFTKSCISFTQQKWRFWGLSDQSQQDFMREHKRFRVQLCWCRRRKSNYKWNMINQYQYQYHVTMFSPSNTNTNTNTV